MSANAARPVGEGDVIGPDVELEPLLAHNATEDCSRVNAFNTQN